MRNIKYGVGALALAALVLTGCSGGGSGAEESKAADKSAGAENTAAATEDAATSDCPELKEGATVEAGVLSTCITDEAESIEGFAMKGSAMGMETTTKSNPGAKEYEMTTPAGSVIVVGGKGYVQPAGGAWAAADPNSSDPIIAGLSGAAESMAKGASGLDLSGLTGEFKVTGTDTKLGQEVFKLEGTSTLEGASAASTYYLTKDYGVLQFDTSAEAQGVKVDTSSVTTEWDKKQDIKAPM